MKGKDGLLDISVKCVEFYPSSEVTALGEKENKSR